MNRGQAERRIRKQSDVWFMTTQGPNYGKLLRLFEEDGVLFGVVELAGIVQVELPLTQIYIR